MQVLWVVKLFAKFGNYEGREHTKTVYPLDVYIARLLELGHPFLEFTDYEDALTEQRCWIYSTWVYWESMNAVERMEYLERHG